MSLCCVLAMSLCSDLVQDTALITISTQGYVVEMVTSNLLGKRGKILVGNPTMV